MDYEKLIPECLRILVEKGIMTKGESDRIFSELTESDDERIRKELISFVNKYYGEETKKEVIAYLEKQKGQKPITHKYNVGATIYYNSFGEIKSMVVANVVDNGDGNPMYEDVDGSAVFEKDLVLQLPVEPQEQKPAEWSEEDLNMIGSIRSTIELDIQRDGKFPEIKEAHEKELKWFDDLYQRNISVKKQEWSEEDNRRLNAIIFELKRTNHMIDWYTPTFLIDWLKSLRPQPHWKPSEEQYNISERFAKIVRANITEISKDAQKQDARADR